MTCFNETIIKESKVHLNTGNATWLFNYLFMREAETYQLLTVGLLNFLLFGLIETKKNVHKMIIIIELQVLHRNKSKFQFCINNILVLSWGVLTL